MTNEQQTTKPAFLSKKWLLGLLAAVLAAAIGYATQSCTPQQVQQAQDVKAQANTVCESRFLERLAPVLLTEQQAQLTLDAAKYACAAAKSECVDEVLEARKAQLVTPPEFQDAGAPQAAPVTAPVPDAAPSLEERR